MATRMQQRRGTAAQWISTNSGNGPILNAGEIGYETDTNKFKIGDGTNHWINLDYFVDANSTVNPSFGSSITFEGATADSYETTLQVTDPTADRTITFPDATGTVQLRVTDVSDTEIGYLDGVTSAIQTQLDDKSTASKTETFTNKSISLGSNTVTSTLAQLNTAISDADVASLAGTETLTNKTLTTPTINGPTITDTGQTPTIHGIYLPAPHNIIFEGTTADDFETTLQAGEPTADRTITLPDATGTVALTSDITTAINNLVDGAPAALDTLNELAAALGDDASYASTITTALGNKQDKVTDVSDTEIGYLNGVTSAIQTQLDAKIAKSLVDAAGDLLIGTADNTVGRLAIGTTGYLLTSNGTTAEWAAAPASGPTAVEIIMGVY